MSNVIFKFVQINMTHLLYLAQYKITLVNVYVDLLVFTRIAGTS